MVTWNTDSRIGHFPVGHTLSGHAYPALYDWFRIKTPGDYRCSANRAGQVMALFTVVVYQLEYQALRIRHGFFI